MRSRHSTNNCLYISKQHPFARWLSLQSLAPSAAPRGGVPYLSLEWIGHLYGSDPFRRVSYLCLKRCFNSSVYPHSI